MYTLPLWSEEDNTPHEQMKAALSRARGSADELIASASQLQTRQSRVNAMGLWILETQLEISNLAYDLGREGGGGKSLREYLTIWRDLAAAIALPEIRQPIPKTLRQKIIERDMRICAYCGKSGNATHGPDGEHWHIDHVLPVSAGGMNEESNLTLACASCNLRKSATIDWVYTP